MSKTINALALMLALSGAAFAREEFTRAFDKTVPLGAGQRLTVEHSLGDIDIRTHQAPEVIIHADIKVSAPDANAAKIYGNDIAILVEPSGGGVSVRTRYPDRSSSGGLKNVS